MSKYVYSFGGGTADGDGTMKDTLGGKGAGLAEMSRAGLPVPPGFTIATDVCNIYFKNKNNVPAEIQKEIDNAIAKLEKQMGQKLGDAVESAAAQRPLRREVLHARHDEHHSEPGPERQHHRRPRREKRQRAFRLRLLSPLHPDVRRSRARCRDGEVRPHLRLAQSEGQGQARHRTHRRRSEGHHRRLQEARPERNRQAVSRRSARTAFPVARCRVPQLVDSQGQVLPHHGKDSGRYRHRRQRAGNGVRQHGRHLRHRRRLHARSRLRRKSLLRRIPDERAGRRRRRRHSHAASDCRSAESFARSLPAASRHHDEPRKALQRHAGFRVHHSGRQALHAADPEWQAHGSRGCAHRRRDGGRRHDLEEGSGDARGSCAARSAAAPGLRSENAQRPGEGDDRHFRFARRRGWARCVLR